MKNGASLPTVVQAPKGIGTILPTSLMPVGANTSRPAAVTGLHLVRGKLLASVIARVAFTVLPRPTVTVCGAPRRLLNTARLPIGRPARFTAWMNGKPSSVQARPDRLVK